MSYARKRALLMEALGKAVHARVKFIKKEEQP